MRLLLDKFNFSSLFCYSEDKRADVASLGKRNKTTPLTAPLCKWVPDFGWGGKCSGKKGMGSAFNPLPLATGLWNYLITLRQSSYEADFGLPLCLKEVLLYPVVKKKLRWN